MTTAVYSDVSDRLLNIKIDALPSAVQHSVPCEIYKTDWCDLY